MSLRLTRTFVPHSLFVALPVVILISLGFSVSVWASDPSTASPQGSSSEPTVIAEGKHGFRVTEKDVQELIDFFKTYTIFDTTEKEYRRYTVQTFLFAKEAERLGLVSETEALPEDPVPRRLALANIYLEHRLKNLKLEPEAVLSYYRAFPERYLKDPTDKKWETQPRPLIEESDLLPFDQVAPQIEAFIRGQLRKRVELWAYEDLLSAYQVAMK
ncbi:MAG: hypothetical protein WHS46_00250 [Desulfosoma sp.]